MMDEIFQDNDVQRVFEVTDGEGVAPKFDDLGDGDRQLVLQFISADQDPGKLESPANLVRSCTAGVAAFEQLSDPVPGSCAPGWKKFILYITSLNTQTLWDRFHKTDGRSYEVGIFADWVVSSVERNGWGPDGNSTPLGKQHSYCMAVAAEAGGGITIDPATGRAQAPDGSAARSYAQVSIIVLEVPRSVAAEPPTGSKWQIAKERARQAQQHINPVALQHAVDSVQDALTESKIAKVDKTTGKLKIRKLGVVRAAVQPTRTLRRAVEGAAVTDRLQAYNQSAARVSQGPTGGDTNSVAEFASYSSKRDYLRDWSRRLVLAAGAAPTEQLVTQHAEMGAAAVSAMVFLRQLGAPNGIMDIGQYFSGGTRPLGSDLEIIDALYAGVVSKLVGQREMVDETIVTFLAGCWPEWVAGIRGR